MKCAALLLATAFLALAAAQTDVEQNLKQKLRQARELLQSGACKHVYLDVGTNKGVQLRKLFEPQHYPGAGILHKYAAHFGANSGDVCAFAFEPNVLHQEWLNEMEKVYRKKGHKLVIFTTTAVSVSGGTATFYRTLGKKHKEEVGASLIDWRKDDTTVPVTVALLNLSEFITDYVLTRAGQRPDSRILMKMDIEGAEYDVVPHLLAHGALCRVNEAMIEWHRRKVKTASRKFPDEVKNMLAMSKDCPCVFGKFDDETYARDNRPLPLLRG